MTQDTNQNPLAFSCACGTVQGHLSPDGAKVGTHVECYCADCRANELLHNQPDPAPEAVRLLQISPDALTVTQGAEHLCPIRLSPRGILRWHASCCKTPIANSLPNPKLPFAGVRTAVFADPSTFGKVRVKAFIPQPGKQPRTKGAMLMVISMFKRMGAALLSGAWRNTPFFDTDTGKPIAEVKLLSKEERAPLYR
ncbi:hypothetical protein KMP13_03385 [Epibacterium ulvae]|uniref:DUF6151 family protein n=1 Tax=Epibacterium ulvae TaxID=1156985 RepID=UPI001BFC7A90|nr:DUF6151 family protein [Epibacterium ulvae]MBT8152945.1 hypothetical protein [Epibacterium ulvae]